MLRILRELHKKKIISMRSIKELKRLFMSALENHQIINDYFCLKLLISYSIFFGKCLSGLLLIAYYSKPKPESSIRNEIIFNLNSIGRWFRFIFINGFSFISVLIITMTCKQVSKSVTNVIMNCYLLQSKIRYNSYEYKEIRALWTFMFENQLSFSAAGFFDVHPSILLSISASTVTYFLVLIQLN
ncbi:hypothetical protein ABEB36_004010 [Hypothenemus hampei]|uniref:Uncharacterized protein n=1 Tax=Hypothenemus hampei TaxID=57062 RepID=A0ABD1F1Z7_HYPHA